MLKDINPGTASSNPQLFTKLNSKLYFIANNGSTPGNYNLWATDGTANGTSLIKDFNSNGRTTGWPLTLCNNKLIFSVGVGTNGYELWATDGTTNGTVKVKNFNSYIPSFTLFNNRLYFTVDDGVSGYEVWVTDGTVNGTVLFNDINPNPGSSSYPRFYTAYNNRLYFLATIDDFHHQLYSSDGNPDSTKMIDIPNAIDIDYSYGTYENEPVLRVNNGSLYLVVNNTTLGKEPYILTTTVNTNIINLGSINSLTELFPNPATDLITIKLNHGTQQAAYSITNQIGQTMLSGNLADETSVIDVTALAAGMYFIKVGEHNHQSIKLIKQ